MTPDLMESGVERVAKHAVAPVAGSSTESGGRSAGYSRVAQAGEVDVTHGRILYLEDVNVSVVGFQAIDILSLVFAPCDLC